MIFAWLVVLSVLGACLWWVLVEPHAFDITEVPDVDTAPVVGPVKPPDRPYRKMVEEICEVVPECKGAEVLIEQACESAYADGVNALRAALVHESGLDFALADQIASNAVEAMGRRHVVTDSNWPGWAPEWRQ